MWNMRGGGIKETARVFSVSSWKKNGLTAGKVIVLLLLFFVLVWWELVGVHRN